MKFYRKVPRIGKKRNAGFTYSNLAAIYFKVVSLGTYTASHLFPKLQKHCGNHVLMLSSTACDSFWISDTVSKRLPFSFIFNLGNKGNNRELSPATREDGGNDNHVVVSHKLCGFQGRVS
jgi:hypothetical protein